MSELKKIGLPVKRNSSGFPPISLEWVWARQVEGGFEIDNVPFFSAFTYRDVVRVKESSEGLVAVERISSCGWVSVVQSVPNLDVLAEYKSWLVSNGFFQETWASKLLISVCFPASREAEIDAKIVEFGGSVFFSPAPDIV